MKLDRFTLGFYCGTLAIVFCHFLVYGPWIFTLGCVLAMLMIAIEADKIED